MNYLIIYDISNDRIRTHIANYLLQRNCTRIQKSVFFGKMDAKKYTEVKTYLEDLQSEYDNEDSLLLVPLSRNHLQQTYMIGSNPAFLHAQEDHNVLIF